MWYFAWILGTLLACAFGVITALALEHVEATKASRTKSTDEHVRDTDAVCAVMDKGPLRALSLMMLALLLAGCIFWDPSRFAAKTSELEIWHGFLLMWAVCAGVIHGVGFRPRAIHWQGLFRPAAGADRAAAGNLLVLPLSSVSARKGCFTAADVSFCQRLVRKSPENPSTACGPHGP